MSRTTGAEPLVTDDRDQTLARSSAMASAMPDRVVASSWWKVRTKREAIRSLKRHVANAVYRQLLVDAHKLGPGRTSGNDS